MSDGINRLISRRGALGLGFSVAVGNMSSERALSELVPQSVEALWADFDPRVDPLQTETVREWKEDGAVLRHVRFLIGTFKGTRSFMAAFYGFPVDTPSRRPGVMHIHGGGQRASLDEVKAMVAQGYASLSVNWGGREMERAQAGDANTDWGAVDPTQQNVAGYFSMAPGPKQLFEDRPHPKNCNWYLLTIGCRRGLTFLEQQPQVDPHRLGVHGLSMGGNLTMYVAGTDARVKCAVPAVGGQGWRTVAHPFAGGVEQQEHIQGDIELFRRTLSFESYAPRIRCPLFHRSATNDFHGWMDDVYRTDALIKGQPVRHAWSPHLNHRLVPEVAVSMPLWFNHFLRGGIALPETPRSTLELKPESNSPRLKVWTKASWPTARCEIFYSIDPDPRARFWRSADVLRSGDDFTAYLPLYEAGMPLFTFANVYYSLPEPLQMGQLPELRNLTIRELCISSNLHRATTEQLEAATVRVLAPRTGPFEEFAHGWRDWFRFEVDNPDYWQYWTRKITDASWRGGKDAILTITLQTRGGNRMVVVAIENEWRSYRGPRKTFVRPVTLPNLPGPQTIELAPETFRDATTGMPMTSWEQIDLLGLCADYGENSKLMSTQHTEGPAPHFFELDWA